MPDDEIICPHNTHVGDYCDKCHGDLELQAQDAEEELQAKVEALTDNEIEQEMLNKNHEEN